jgi:hypothetical protein
MWPNYPLIPLGTEAVKSYIQKRGRAEMTLEDRLARWTQPSSDTEQDKQDRTERMVREAIAAHPAFQDCPLRVFAKGSYANNTNVRVDSDVDIAVECTAAEYWGEHEAGAHPPASPYQGVWTPSKLRAELVSALNARFPSAVNTDGPTAIRINSNSARVDADVVPCFSYKYYLSQTNWRAGTKLFRKDGKGIANFPQQQLELGRSKNSRTGNAYKKTVRILKRVAIELADSGSIRALPSYFVECLVYNCPDEFFGEPTWTSTVRRVLAHVWQSLDGDEPTTGRWLECNECLYLFHGNQKWTREDGRAFASEAWKYLAF